MFFLHSVDVETTEPLTKGKRLERAEVENRDIDEREPTKEFGGGRNAGNDSSDDEAAVSTTDLLHMQHT